MVVAVVRSTRGPTGGRPLGHTVATNVPLRRPVTRSSRVGPAPTDTRSGGHRPPETVSVPETSRVTTSVRRCPRGGWWRRWRWSRTTGGVGVRGLSKGRLVPPVSFGGSGTPRVSRAGRELDTPPPPPPVSPVVTPVTRPPVDVGRVSLTEGRTPRGLDAWDTPTPSSSPRPYRGSDTRPRPTARGRQGSPRPESTPTVARTGLPDGFEGRGPVGPWSGPVGSVRPRVCGEGLRSPHGTDGVLVGTPSV